MFCLCLPLHNYINTRSAFYKCVIKVTISCYLFSHTSCNKAVWVTAEDATFQVEWQIVNSLNNITVCIHLLLKKKKSKEKENRAAVGFWNVSVQN